MHLVLSLYLALSVATIGATAAPLGDNSIPRDVLSKRATIAPVSCGRKYPAIVLLVSTILIVYCSKHQPARLATTVGPGRI
jgi:hypothetical protein